MNTQTKGYSCRVKGIKRIQFYVSPERKERLKASCKRRGISIAGLINTLLYNEIQ